MRDEIIDATVRLTVQNHARRHQATLREIAKSAVRETLGTCVTAAAGIIAHHLCAFHAELFDDVLKNDRVFLAKEQSLDTTTMDPALTTAENEQNKRRSVEEQPDAAEGAASQRAIPRLSQIRPAPSRRI